MKTFSITLMASLVLITSSTAHAGWRENFMINRAMSALDSNQNKALELSELQNQGQKNFNRFDRDANRQLSNHEFSVMLQTQVKRLSRITGKQLPSPAQTAKLFNKLDKNRNQQLSFQEIRQQRLQSFRRADRNKSNSIDAHEFKAMMSNRL